MIAYRYSTIISYWTKFPRVSQFKKKAIFTFRTAFPYAFAMKFQRRHWLGNFAWRMEITFARDTKIEVIDGEFPLCIDHYY